MKLSRSEIRDAFTGGKWPEVLSVVQLAELVGKSPKTMYLWIDEGKLDGAVKKQGKHWLIWRDKAIECLFST
jgi:hypothetical protein